MNTSIDISEVIQYGPDLTEDQIIDIAENMASIYSLKNETADKSIKKVAFEKDFEESAKTTKSVLKMSKTEHIDGFFRDGSIQLGSFSYYNQFDNPEIGDNTEGRFIIVGQNSISTTFAVVGGGYNNYIFCTYNGEPNPELIKKFGYDDYFEIIDLDGFQDAISRTLDSIVFLRSDCQYRQMKVLVGKADENFKLTELSGELLNLVNYSKYFLKTSHFQHQKEHRFLWTVPYDLKKNLIIKCPEAIQFCRRK
jgi:hypothetical protein